jgi:hypothetical protein
LVEAAGIPVGERAQIMIGAELFFQRGWPIHHFTIAMAARAGMGQVPPIYEGLGTEGRYFGTVTMPRAEVEESERKVSELESDTRGTEDKDEDAS